DRLNELDLDHEADFCENLQEDAARHDRSLSARLHEQQDGASCLGSGYYRCNTGIAGRFLVLALNSITP
ncbi:Rop family plasmid primer RNA-binding protein, partial [Klebsiella pneumoniae]|uniref:Rop family plasmid primer RNA-binding protein n=1 Tax=Klebsiella pneumoniae TaxID=573 RepID=UPI0023810AE0